MEAKFTPAQFVRQRFPTAKRELAANGYQIVAGGETLGQSNLPNHAWECAARAVARAEGNNAADPWKDDASTKAVQS